MFQTTKRICRAMKRTVAKMASTSARPKALAKAQAPIESKGVAVKAKQTVTPEFFARFGQTDELLAQSLTCLSMDLIAVISSYCMFNAPNARSKPQYLHSLSVAARDDNSSREINCFRISPDGRQIYLVEGARLDSLATVYVFEDGGKLLSTHNAGDKRFQLREPLSVVFGPLSLREIYFADRRSGSSPAVLACDMNCRNWRLVCGKE